MSPTSHTLSTHVLDAARGEPAGGLEVTLAAAAAHGGGAAPVLAHTTTDDDGRVAFDVALEPGVHTLTFATGAWFAALGRETFLPLVTLTFEVAASRPHHHVALLLSPFAYTCYRGS